MLRKYTFSSECGIWGNEPRMDWKLLATISGVATISNHFHGMSGWCPNARPFNEERTTRSTENGWRVSSVNCNSTFTWTCFHHCFRWMILLTGFVYFFRTSLQYGICCLKRLGYNRKELEERRKRCENQVKGDKTEKKLLFLFCSYS